MSRIFISYRRRDSEGFASLIMDSLYQRFGAENVFIDLDHIEPGDDFMDVINTGLARCEVVLVLIGPNWLSIEDDQGRRRLDDPHDLVRLEVAVAIERDIRVVPVLVDGARMPSDDELPLDLAPLARRSAISVSHEGFRDKLNRLMDALSRALAAPNESSGTVDDVSASDSEVFDEHGELSVGQERRLRDHDKPISSIAFCPDSQVLASAGGGEWLGGGDTGIRLWRVSDGQRLRTLSYHKATVNKLLFSRDNELLVSCCNESIALWRPADGERLGTLPRGGSDLAFSRDGTRLAVWSHSGLSGFDPWEDPDIQFDLWSVADSKYLGNGASGELFDKADFQWRRVSADGCMVVSTSTTEKVKGNEFRVMSLRTTGNGELLRELRIRNAGGIQDVVFSADGALLANSLVMTAEVRIWRVSDGKRLTTIKWSESACARCIAFADDGKWVAVACEDRLVRMWPILRTGTT